jgi:hypothetical protein
MKQPGNGPALRSCLIRDEQAALFDLGAFARHHLAMKAWRLNIQFRSLGERLLAGI